MNNEEVLSFLKSVANQKSKIPNSSVTVTKKIVDNQDTFCLTVPGTAFLIKKNGKTSITGNSHKSLMISVIREVFDFSKESDQQILREALMTAAEQEIKWGAEIYGDKILGISTQSTESYVKYITNQLSKLVGIGILYKGFTTDPYAYLDQAKKENFFETAVTEYSQSTAVSGWDSF